MSSIHQFKVAGIKQEEEIDFADFKGKKILVVNVASACGYTPQYQQLQELYEHFNDNSCNGFFRVMILKMRNPVTIALYNSFVNEITE